MRNNATFLIWPLFSQHVLGQTIHWQLPKERWPTVGTVNGRIGGTKMRSRRRKNLLRRGCDTAPFSRRRDWRCRAYELSERALSNSYAPKLLTACSVHASVNHTQLSIHSHFSCTALYIAYFQYFPPPYIIYNMFVCV